VPADSVSIRIYSGIARFPCDSMAFLFIMLPLISVRDF